MRTRDQEYAATIYEQVEGVRDAERKKYGSMAHTLPVLIRTAGLAQALAFVEARGEQPQRLLLDHLATAVGAGTRQDLQVRSRTAELGLYMLLTREVLAALLWYKRFAQSVLHVEAGDDEQVIADGQQPGGGQP